MVIIFSFFFLSFLTGQEKEKDTLFFKYDKKYIKTYVEIPKHYYLDEISDANNGTFFFNEVRIANEVKAKKMLCLKKFVRNSKFYNKKQKLDDYQLGVFLNQYILYLVRKNGDYNEYIQVEAAVEIE